MEGQSTASRVTKTGWRRGRRLGLVAAAGGLAVVGAACLPTKPPPPPPPTEAQLQITPASESFTDDFPDPGAQTKQFTVTNVGGEPTGVLSDTLESVTAEFSVATPDSCDGVTLAPGVSCTTSVQFTAGDAAGTTNGQFIVKATPGGTASANLSGTRTPTPVPQVPAIKVGPTSVFLFADGGQTDSPPVEVGILNQGTGDATNVQLVVTTTSGEGIQEVSRTCGADGFTLAPGTSCSITVKWSPNLTLSADGQLSISGDNFATIIVPIDASID